MFEQSILSSPQNARKPYAMVLSLILQILALGALCMLPFVIAQSPPGARLKELVLAAPPKTPSVLAKQPPASRTTAAPRLFRIVPLPLQVKPASAFTTKGNTPAPEVEMGSPDTSQLPAGIAASLPAEPPPPPAAKPRPVTLLRAGSIMQTKLIRIVRPTYPPLARTSRIQGAVEFTATISKQGTIENLTLLRGHPLLVNAAREAVLQWRYRPTLLNGEPVEVLPGILVNFTLNQ